MTAALVVKARSSFPHPFPNWMTEAERWYDHLLGALAWASVAISCVMYLRYRADAERAGRVAIARPWRTRHDVRLVLYAYAATSFAQFPIGVYRSIVALSDRSGADTCAQHLLGVPHWRSSISAPGCRARSLRPPPRDAGGAESGKPVFSVWI